MYFLESNLIEKLQKIISAICANVEIRVTSVYEFEGAELIGGRFLPINSGDDSIN